ncbi:IS1182 family transposase [Rhodococcus jostii]|uniref:IS1182 family transposase n=1 Tax=Rhodococcus jostii TaxID=132919 RepID=UPI00362F5FC5
MSLQPKGLSEIPEQTARVARAAFPQGTLAIRVRDRLGEVFADEPFTAAFGMRGAPALLSLVSVLQYTENLTDRQAAQMAVRAIDWKYALGMELSDPGFDFSVLSKFRARLAGHGMERVVFDRLLEFCIGDGLITAGGKQRTDSTHVISAVRDLNRLELAGESVRAALGALAVAAPDWLAGAIDVGEFAHRYGPRVDSWRLPESKTKRDRLAVVYGQDAVTLLRAVHSAAAPAWLAELPAVELLRQMLVQTYYLCTDNRGREVIVRRDAQEHGVPPGRTRLASPYDPDARWAAKGDDLFWLGYKLHLTETCDAEAEAGGREAGTGPRPNLITDVHTTDATVPDVNTTAGIQQRLTEHEIAPGEHYLDSGYPSADLVAAAARDGITMVTPLLADQSRQARNQEGFDKAAFAVDWTARQVRCPAGQTSAHWNPVRQHGRDAIVVAIVAFGGRVCRPCEFQARWTASQRGRRMLTLRPKQLHETVTAARAEQETKTWKDKYALRSGVEATINQALDHTGIRHARYRSLPKVRLQHVFSATALNVIRLDAHWTGQPFNPARTSRLTQLSYQLAG